MEAMACGLPVICSRIGGTGAMIADGVDGLLVPQRDPAAIAAAIARLDDDPRLRRRIGAAARRTAEARFDYRALAERLGAEIRKALAARATRPTGLLSSEARSSREPRLTSR
jgi:glycosyltransferase involved in cell wall biosynthesis